MLTSIYKRKGRRGFTLAFEEPGSPRVRQKQFRTRALAIAYRDELRKKSGHSLEPAVSSDMTFSDYADRWLRATKTAVRRGTYRVYESAVRVHLKPAFPGNVAAISRARVRDLVVEKRELGLKRKTVRNIRGALHAVLEAAVEEGIIATNPAHFRAKSKLMRLGATVGEARSTVKAFDLEQARDFFANAPTFAPHHYMLWRTTFACGLRPGEGQGLQPADLDYQRFRIRIARAITRGVVGPCKTTEQGEFEEVDMPEGLAEELRAWEAATAAGALSDGRRRSDWLFPNSTDGGFLDEKGARDAFKRVLKAAGLPLHFSQQSLRHSYATQLLIAGESVYYVSRQLRHADIKITVKVYGSSLPAGNREAADRHFERLTGPPRAGRHSARHNS